MSSTPDIVSDTSVLPNDTAEIDSTSSTPNLNQVNKDETKLDSSYSGYFPERIRKKNYFIRFLTFCFNS